MADTNNLKKFLDYAGVSTLWSRVAEEVNKVDAKAIKNAEDIVALGQEDERLAGLITANASAIADNVAAIATNKGAIETLNGDANTAGSVAKAVADAEGRVDGKLKVITDDMGDVDNLETTNKVLVAAINEVRNAVSVGGTAAAVTMTTATTTEGALKSYTIKQGEAVVGTIDIPKDMVVESGEVVTNPEGQAEGTYIKLVLANVAEPLYVNVGTLVDIYKASANAAQVQIAIDSASREISASIVAGSVGTTELADNAVVTAKIADANVTKAKLSVAVQASLDKADAAATKAEFDLVVERAKAAEAQALADAKAYTNEKVGAEKLRAEGVEGGLDTRLQAVEGKLGTGTDSVSAQIDAAKQEALQAATNAETNAKAYVDTEFAKIQALSTEEINAAIAAAKNNA